jgi:hypothetical protein
MGSLVTIGLKSIEFAPLASDGGPGTVFAKYGNVSTDSLSFAEAEPTVKTVDIEESQYPLKRFKTRGDFTVTANIADADTDAFAALRGGTLAATSGKKTYSDGDSFNNVERTVRITPSEGLQFIINRCDVQGLLNGGLGKNQELFLALTLTALQPTKSGVKAVEMVETVPVV